MVHTNEIDLIVQFANEKGGGTDGQLIIDDVELERSRDNRTRHGIGNGEPQVIEKGNNTYTFSTTAYMNSASARALQRIYDGRAETQAVYVEDDGVWKDRADGLVFNTLTTSSSDDGDTTVQIDADLLGLDLDGTAPNNA
jgi:choline dehydrogenase-like flavoprotein